jgi:hypothetical protein
MKTKNFKKNHYRQFKLTAIGVLLTTAAFAQTPNLLVCADRGYTLSPVSDKGAQGTSLAYKWYEKDNTDEYTVMSNQTEASLSVSANTKNAGTYSYVRTVTGTNCAAEVASNTYTVVVLKPAVPTIIAPTNVCQNAGNLVFTASGDAGSTFTWTGANDPTGDNKNTYTVLGSGTAQTYSLQATASVGYVGGALTKTCTSGSSTVAQAAINPLPTVTQTGTTAWCGSASQQLQVTAKVGEETSGLTVKWYDNNGASGKALSETTTYTVPAATGPSGVKTFTYYVQATVSATSCVNSPLAAITGTRNLYEGEITGAEN